MADDIEARKEELYVTPEAITEENVTKDEDVDVYMFDDGAALELVLQDTQTDDSFVNLLQWAAGWTLSDTLYQSPQTLSAFDGGNVAQANVPKFMVSNHISSIVPKVMGGIFYEDPPFMLRPFPGTSQEVIRAKTALFAAELWEMKFEEECERALDQMALLGTCIMKWGYTEYTDKTKKRQRKSAELTERDSAGNVRKFPSADSDDFEIIYEDKLVSRPWIKYCDIRTVLVDSGCRYGDIRRAGHVIYRDYATYEDLDRLRGQDGYDIPDEDVLKRFFFDRATPKPDNISLTIPEGMRGYLQHALPRTFRTTADPMGNTLEILERWDNEKVIVVLSYNGHNILIRNEANPYRKIPFYSANWRNIPDCFYGQGLGLLIGAEQLVEQGVTNLAMDLLAYGLQPTAVRKRGFNVTTQATRWQLGGIIDVDEDVDKAFRFLEMPHVPGEAWQFISQAKAAASETSGANELVGMGATLRGAQSTGMRSGTGAAGVIAANASRLDGPDGRFVRQIFEPWLYQMDELINDLTPTKVIRQILGEELGDEFELDHEKFRNAKIEYEVLAGSKLGAKKEMAQFLPFILNILNNPVFTKNINDGGMMWDGVAIFKAFADAAGWKFSQNFLRPMSQEEKQRYDANTPAALQRNQQAAQQAQQLAQFQHDERMKDAEQLGRAGAEVMRQTVEQALTPEAVEGQPGNRGFGDVTEL
jgi:hypothetical protein